MMKEREGRKDKEDERRLRHKEVKEKLIKDLQKYLQIQDKWKTNRGVEDKRGKRRSKEE